MNQVRKNTMLKLIIFIIVHIIQMKIKKYSKKSKLRKPENGMLLNAIKNLKFIQSVL